MKNSDLIIVDSRVLPSVFGGVIKAKELIATGKAENTSQAIKMAGISRSAFYKYRDFVFKYTDNDTDNISLSAILSDKAGVFSALTAVLYECGANIITLNQGIPVDGAAAVSITIKTGGLNIPLEALIAELQSVDGVISVKAV